jgi:sarcosine oxidase subunit gamma
MARAAKIMTPSAVRRSVLDGRVAAHAGVSVRPGPPAARLALRAPDATIASLDQALGLALPRKPKTSTILGSRSALWLGPDEWLVIDADGAGLASACAGVTQFHSAVDVSHRNVAILVEGQAAEATISAGCPQDLSIEAFPVGACSRTILGKIEIVLWRTGELSFHIECWRSFSDYAFTFLADAARDAAA